MSSRKILNKNKKNITKRRNSRKLRNKGGNIFDSLKNAAVGTVSSAVNKGKNLALGAVSRAKDTAIGVASRTPMGMAANTALNKTKSLYSNEDNEPKKSSFSGFMNLFSSKKKENQETINEEEPKEEINENKNNLEETNGEPEKSVTFAEPEKVVFVPVNKDNFEDIESMPTNNEKLPVAEPENENQMNKNFQEQMDEINQSVKEIKTNIVDKNEKSSIDVENEIPKNLVKKPASFKIFGVCPEHYEVAGGKKQKRKSSKKSKKSKSKSKKSKSKSKKSRKNKRRTNRSKK
jgi:hypothetical protein